MTIHVRSENLYESADARPKSKYSQVRVCQECGWEDGEMIARNGEGITLRVERQDTGLMLCQFCAEGEWHGGQPWPL